MSPTQVPCDHCEGTGFITLVADDTGTKRMVMCGSCMSSGHVQEDDRPGTQETEIRRQSEEGE